MIHEGKSNIFHIAVSHSTKANIPPSVKIPLCYEFKDIFYRRFNIRIKTCYGLFPAVTMCYLLGKFKNKTNTDITRHLFPNTLRNKRTAEEPKDGKIQYNWNISHLIMKSIQRKQQPC